MLAAAIQLMFALSGALSLAVIANETRHAIIYWRANKRSKRPWTIYG